METRPNAALTAALAAVQKALPKIPKSKTAKVPTKNGGEYSYKYADLAEVSAIVLPLLGEHGLAWSCLPELVDGRFQLRGQLRHVGGDMLEATWPLPVDASPQTLGGHLTYARRYLLCSVVGVAADEDDDAQLASGRAEQPPARRRQQRQPEPADDQAQAGPGPEPDDDKPSRAMVSALHASLSDFGLSDRESKLVFCSGWVGRELTSSSELSKAEVKGLLDHLRAELAEQRKAEAAGGA